MSNNVSQITEAGICVGCGACSGCEHIKFEANHLGFPAPIVDDNCIQCGTCLSKCIYNPANQDNK